METSLDGQHGGQGMMMIGRGNDHRIQVFYLLEQYPVIAIVGDIGQLFAKSFTPSVISVANGDDILTLHVVGIAFALAAGADDGDLQLGGSLSPHDIRSR